MEINKQNAESFVKEVVLPAFDEIKDKLEEHGRIVRIGDGGSSASIQITHVGKSEFTMTVDATRPTPTISTTYVDEDGWHNQNCRAFMSGNRGLDHREEITKEVVIENLLTIYLRS